MDITACPFCQLRPEQFLYHDPLVTAIWDGFPVSPGHALILTNRHTTGWIDATLLEKQALVMAIEVMQRKIQETYTPDGFNFGFNDGSAAGQTVPHLHVHVIPRYQGDLPDPTGGVRNVIPPRGNYLRFVADLENQEQAIAPGRLVCGGNDPLLPHLIRATVAM